MRHGHLIAAVMIALLLALPTSVALAAGSTSSSSSQDTASKLDRAENMIKSGNARDAIPILEKVVQSDKDNADAYNFLGLAHRKLEEYDQAKRYYDKALSVDSQHKGAREYLGELYIQVGKPEKAEQQLARLDEICTYGCEEYDMLESSLAEYRQSH